MAELLSPAGGWDALVAAVQNGADAVYLGLNAFNARAGARNFSPEEFRAAVDYCHLRGVKVYLTLNTLLTDRELPAAAEAAQFADSCGADAVLVQDWGVWELLRQAAPDLVVHASTQMSLHTLSGVREAAENGAARAVLARELSREEIAEICRNAPIEIEVFAHGALCMCYSGQCEMSAVIGRRSGNRGRCAQPCRLPYGFHGKADGHPLGLKDSCLADYVAELDDLGVACLKLEGRLKRPEYVAAVTGIYARLLREHRRATAEEHRQLAEAFSRDGFTQGYYLGKKGASMFGVRPENARWPEAWFDTLRRAYEKEDLRTVPVRFHAVLAADTPMTLTATDDDGHTVTVCGDVPEAARTRALTAEDVIARLQKTGGTAFSAAECSVSVENGLSASASSLNALRRKALTALEEARLARSTHRVGAFVPPAPCENPTAPPELTVSLARAEQLTPELIAEHPALVMLPLACFDTADLAPYAEQTRFCAVLPRIYRTAEEAALRDALLRAKAHGADAAAIGNLGHLPLARGLGMELRGDFSLNVCNSAALAFLHRRGLDTATLSFELRNEQLRDVRKQIPCEAIVYGRLPLMITENCIVQLAQGHRCGDVPDGIVPAAASGERFPLLTDARGEQFPVLRAHGCRSEIENAKTLYLADRAEWKTVGLSFARLRFTTETPEECVRVLRAYRGKGDAAPANLTRGLYYRGVL